MTTLSERLASDVELQSFSVDTFPTVHVRGEGLVVRLRGSEGLPPLFVIRSFSIRGGLLGMLERPRRFSSVTLDGLEINIPPGGPELPDEFSGERGTQTPGLEVEKLYSTDAVLRVISAEAGKAPLEFPIHSLEMDGVGARARMPFRAELTNPVPAGTITTEGHFGPWNRERPGRTALDGTYNFDEVDLATIDGIGGTLSSAGEFGGRLAHIDVKGTTDTPDFHLAHAGNRMRLVTRFHAVVDGTDGDTYLKTVNATLGGTPIVANGAVAGAPGVKGRRVRLDVRVPGGRIEDLLRLSVKGDEPPFTGRVSLRTGFDLPPGRGPVLERLRLDGAFDISSAEFTDGKVRDKLAGMSARAQGEPEDKPDRLITDLEGRFTVAGGSIRLQALRFRIPGAAVHMAGTYDLRSEELRFDGTLRMEATVSEASGAEGIAGFLLKAVDPFFRKKGAGAVLPIKVRGTREKPDIGLDVVRAITPK